MFDGKQKEAEQLATDLIRSGLRSNEGGKTKWVNDVTINAGPWRDAAKKYTTTLNGKRCTCLLMKDGKLIGYEGLDGAVWFRTTFVLPDNWRKKFDTRSQSHPRS